MEGGRVLGRYGNEVMKMWNEIKECIKARKERNEARDDLHTSSIFTGMR